jgi:hypothetical protein
VISVVESRVFACILDQKELNLFALEKLLLFLSMKRSDLDRGGVWYLEQWGFEAILKEDSSSSLIFGEGSFQHHFKQQYLKTSTTTLQTASCSSREVSRVDSGHNARSETSQRFFRACTGASVPWTA